MTSLPRTLLWLLVVAGVAVALVGAVRLTNAPSLPQVGAVPPAHPTQPAAASAAPVASAQADATGAPPVHLSLPAQHVEAPVVAVGVLPGGGLEVPDDPQVLGWWRNGASPGATRGTVVIDGHVDSREAGEGALFHLRELPPGAVLSVATGSGALHYTVRAVHSYPKASLPSEIFDRTGAPRLVLISCGGQFDAHTRQYSDNIVAYATPTP